MPRVLATLALSFGLLLTLAPQSAGADDSLDFDVTGGHFFSQTNGTGLGLRGGGY